jgi:hypothetical protein
LDGLAAVGDLDRVAAGGDAGPDFREDGFGFFAARVVAGQVHAVGELAGCDTVEITDRREAIQRAAADARPGDILLLAGKGHETYQEVHGRKTPFDDIEVLREAFFHLGVV